MYYERILSIQNFWVVDPETYVSGIDTVAQYLYTVDMLDHLADQYLEHLKVERNVSDLTIRNYRHYLKRFLSYLRNHSSPLAAKDLDINIVRKYRLYLTKIKNQKGEPISSKTQGYHVIALRSFLRYLIKNDIKTLEPDKIDIPKPEARQVEVLDLDQLERLLAQPNTGKLNELRDKAILEMLFSTGLRVAELCCLDRDQVNLERKEFGVIGKGRRPRIVFLSDRAVHWLERYVSQRTDDYQPLFISHLGKQPDIKKTITHANTGNKYRLTPRSVQRAVTKYAKRARLPIKPTPHTLRHTFATDLLTSGADIRSVQEMLGHKNIATTQIYTHVTNPQLKKIHEKFHRGNK